MTNSNTPDPDEARALERIERALASVGAEHAPPVGWEARVLATAAPRRVWWRWAVPMIALAAAVTLWLWFRDRGPSSPQLAMTIERGDTKLRDGSAESVHLGDTLHITVRGGRHRVLWLYLDQRLLAACPGDPACAVSAKELGLTWSARLLGRYAIVAAFSEQRIPSPEGALDLDLSTAMRAGADHQEKHFEIR